VNFIVAAGVGFSLALDAFAVSVTSGILLAEVKFRHALRIAAFFGAFQALMPLAGWTAGRWAAGWVEGMERWIAFVLLAAVGCKMIWESFSLEKDAERKAALGLAPLLLLSIATSIDAFSVGVGFAFLRVEFLSAVVVIGVVTFLMSFAGVYIGGRIGHVSEGRMEAVGGILLVSLGFYFLLAG